LLYTTHSDAFLIAAVHLFIAAINIAPDRAIPDRECVAIEGR
jgi:hypothetical protein